MQITLAVKLQPTSEQASALLETIERFNSACNYVADVAYQHRMANKYALQKLVYHELRDRFGLSSQMAVRAVGKVVEAYKRDKSKRVQFRPRGAMVYDQRILSWKATDRVSILTLQGRLLIPVQFGEYQAQRLQRVRGQADLIYRNGAFYLLCVVDLPEPPPTPGDGVFGVDLGIANLATDSDGAIYSGKAVDAKRRHYERLRAGVQRVGTRSAKRKLKRFSGRERRFKIGRAHV